MPYLSIQTNQAINEDKIDALLKKTSHAVAEILGKPESYVMTALQDNTPMSFAGNSDPAAYVQLKSLGLPESSTTDFSQAICSLVSSELGISADRIYIEFSGPDRHMWGWNNKTF